jgi:hypothetical protein
MDHGASVALVVEADRFGQILSAKLNALNRGEQFRHWDRRLELIPLLEQIEKLATTSHGTSLRPRDDETPVSDVLYRLIAFLDSRFSQKFD